MRWPFVLVSLLATLSLLFGGGYVFRTRTVDEPLKALYSGSPAVESFSVVSKGTGKEIALKLHKAPDLAVVYRDLNRETNRLLGGAPYTITLQDNRAPEQVAALNRMHLFIQEALVTGAFADMADRIEAEAARRSMTARVGVDGEFVYLQLEQGEHVLYEVTERTPRRQQAQEGGQLW